MRKLLLGLLILLMFGLVVKVIYSGMDIGSFRIFAFYDIQEADSALNEKIDEAGKLKDMTYEQKKDELGMAKEDLKKARDRYDAVASANTIDLVKKAGISSEYNSEYLWVRLRKLCNS